MRPVPCSGHGRAVAQSERRRGRRDVMRKRLRARAFGRDPGPRRALWPAAMRAAPKGRIHGRTNQSALHQESRCKRRAVRSWRKTEVISIWNDFRSAPKSELRLAEISAFMSSRPRRCYRYSPWAVDKGRRSTALCRPGAAGNAGCVSAI